MQGKHRDYTGIYSLESACTLLRHSPKCLGSMPKGFSCKGEFPGVNLEDLSHVIPQEILSEHLYVPIFNWKSINSPDRNVTPVNGLTVSSVKALE